MWVAARFQDAETRYEKFEAAVNRAASSGEPRVLLVTHREGIRDLAQVTGVRGRLKTPYCCIARFAYAHDGKEDAPSAWTMLAPPSVELAEPSDAAAACA